MSNVKEAIHVKAKHSIDAAQHKYKRYYDSEHYSNVFCMIQEFVPGSALWWKNSKKGNKINPHWVIGFVLTVNDNDQVFIVYLQFALLHFVHHVLSQNVGESLT